MRSDSPPAVETANDRFKRGFGSWFWFGLLAATLAHATLFLAFPDIAVADLGPDAVSMKGVEIPERIELPPPPDDVARPAAPEIGDVDVDEELTIPRTDFDANPPSLLPPPPGSRDNDLSRSPTVTPMTLAPRLLNGDEVARVLQRFYPPTLRDAGIGGTVHVWLFLDAEGHVVRTLVNESSGYGDMDAAALRVADRMKFSPAQNRDRPVPVWVTISITFEVGG